MPRMAMGKRIRDERVAKGMEQPALCELVPGLSQQNLSTLEKRDSKTSEWAPRIADALEVSLRWLLTGEGDKKPEWPFKRIPRDRVAALSDVDLLVVEGALLMAIHHLRPHAKNELPSGVVLIPERRQLAARRVSGGIGAMGKTPARRAADKKSGQG